MIETDSFRKKPNQLIHETSPYLLKHAYNPVNWWPWCSEAFDKAKLENKPVFVSIGYFSCHWCNVMEEESFENYQIARYLNENFISIKVDREELPDIDHQFQLVFQIMNNKGGGWPLTIFMTPNQVPFFTGTYFPPKSRMGLIGFFDLLVQIQKAYQNNLGKINSSGQSIVNHLKEIQLKLNDYSQSDLLSLDIVEDAVIDIASLYDKNNAGFGSAPKFPNETTLSFLLSEGIRQNKNIYVKMVKYSLEAMINGGIYDQLGGGFHRYSVDDQWLVPHFEKMLYTQALMADLLLDMYQITEENIFKIKARETLLYAIKELKSPFGGFFSGIDADSEGVEGKYYVWDYDEIINHLGKEAGDIFCLKFNISKKGNWEGKSILNVIKTSDDLAKKFKKSKEEIEEIIEHSKVILLNIRSKRIPPGTDKKVLSGWSALMIRPLLRLSRILSLDSEDTDIFKTAAKDTLDFFVNTMIIDGNLFRVLGFIDSKSNQKKPLIKIHGYLEDYVYVALALIEGFEFFFDPVYLDKSLELTYYFIENFEDKSLGGFFSSKKEHNTPMERYKEIFDSPLPSPNALANVLFEKLFFFTEDSFFLDLANKTVRAFQNATKNISGVGMSSYYLSLAWIHSGNIEIIYLANSTGKVEGNETLWNDLQKIYLPYKLQIMIQDDYSNLPNNMVGRTWMQGKKIKNNASTVFICRNYTCSLPMTTIEEVKEYLKKEYDFRIHLTSN